MNSQQEQENQEIFNQIMREYHILAHQRYRLATLCGRLLRSLGKTHFDNGWIVNAETLILLVRAECGEDVANIVDNEINYSNLVEEEEEEDDVTFDTLITFVEETLANPPVQSEPETEKE